MAKATGPVGRFARKKSGPAFNPFVSFCKLFSTSKEPIKNEIGSGEAAMWMMLFYFWVGSFFYTRIFEDMSTLDSVYFLTVTMTTVGYGDLSPTSRASRIFTIFWAIYGVALVAVALVEIVGLILDTRDAIAAKTRSALLKAGGSTPSEDMDPEVAAKLEALRATKAAAPSANPLRRALQLFPVLEVVGYIAVYALAAGWIFSSVEEGWTFVDGIYYSIVTGTSVGYGDLYPVTRLGRGLALVYLPFAVVFVNTQLSEVPGKVFGGGGGDSKLEKLMAIDLSLEALLAMDDDGDGEVTEFEFLRFMLTSTDLADGATLDAIHGQFCALDEDGSGALTADDLKTEPLGIRPTAAAEAVAAHQEAWGRAMVTAVPPLARRRSQDYTRTALIPAGRRSMSRRPSRPPSPVLGDAERKDEAALELGAGGAGFGGDFAAVPPSRSLLPVDVASASPAAASSSASVPSAAASPKRPPPRPSGGVASLPPCSPRAPQRFEPAPAADGIADKKAAIPPRARSRKSGGGSSSSNSSSSGGGGGSAPSSRESSRAGRRPPAGGGSASRSRGSTPRVYVSSSGSSPAGSDAGSSTGSAGTAGTAGTSMDADRVALLASAASSASSPEGGDASGEVNLDAELA